jgi:hypothetical protein
MNNINKATVSSDAKNLAVFMQAVLEQVVTSFASYNMPLPFRKYWTLGAPAVDCEQVVVSLIQMYVGAPGDEATSPRRCSDPRSATINVSVSRQVPTVGPSGKAPSAENIESYAEISAYDAWILLDSAAQLDTWEPSGGYGVGVIATVEVKEPEGGFQTVTLTLTAAIP